MKFIIDAAMGVSTRFATKDIAGIASIRSRLLIQHPATHSDGLTSNATWPVPSLCKEYSGGFVDDCPFCKSRFFNTLAYANRPVRQKPE